MKEEELKEILARENDEFRELYQQHQEYERRIEKLLSRIALTSDEKTEVKKLKKLKLRVKDRMHEILVKEMEKGNDR